MKTRILICITALILLNSCIVNSLFPFFTQDTISFEKAFLGIWEDKKNNSNRWIVASVEDVYQNAKDKAEEKDIVSYNKYKKGYYIFYEEKSKDRTTAFLAMPFKINDQLFLDFTPLFYDINNTSLESHHLVPTHSLVKFDILDNNTIDIKWLSSDKLEGLIKNNRIKIDYEKIGIENDKYLLTASSNELQKFIKKYMVSNDANKWKTDIKFNLKRTKSPEESLDLIKKIMDNKADLSGKHF